MTFKKGQIPWNKGKHWSEEVKNNISLGKRGLINQPQLCACGCGQLTKRGNRYIHGHNLRVKNPVDKLEVRRKISKTWFKKGEHASIKTEFKNGNTPWWIERGEPHPLTDPKIRERCSKGWFGRLEGPWVCKFCGEEFEDRFTLGGHVSTNHSKGTENLLTWINENGAWNKGLTIDDPRVRKYIENKTFKDTGIELKIQEILTQKGIKYRTNVPMKGIPDIVVGSTVIFVDGCYWHSCPKCGYYDPERWEYDNDVKMVLEKEGYTVLRFWEHEINEDINSCIRQINDVLGGELK